MTMRSAREEVEFRSEGERVSAWFFAGDGTSGESPGPGVVFCPGFTGTKFAAFYEPYTDHLVEAGYNVLMIDYRGWGESGGERGVLDPSAQVEDIRCGLTHLQSRPEQDAARCGLLGMSFGGGNVVQAAAEDPRVKSVVAISPVGDGGLWLRQMRREYEWYELLDRIESDRSRRVAGEAPELVDPVHDIMVETPERKATRVKGSLPEGMVPRSTPLWCADRIRVHQPWRAAAEIRSAAVLLFAGAEDCVVPSEHSRLIYAHAPEPKRLVMFPGREHYGIYLGRFDQVWQEMAEWLRVHLAPAKD